MTANVFTEKDPAETDVFGFDIKNLLAEDGSETIQSVTATLNVRTGTDPAVSSMLSGSAAFRGTIVMQKITAGITGNNYCLDFTIITNFQTIIAAGIIPVTNQC